jgi:L-lactate dehydrogenase complex protein LldF
MSGASWAMSDGARMGLLERGLPLGKAAAGRDGVISKLPGLGAGWTQSRDIPAPPAESFRAQWAKREKNPAAPQGIKEGEGK